MFRKLKQQFIMTNVGIITVLFVSLTIGAYFLLQINMNNHAEFFAIKMAEAINSGMFNDGWFDNQMPLPPGRERPNPFPQPPKAFHALNPNPVFPNPSHQEPQLFAMKKQFDLGGLLMSLRPRERERPGPNVFYVKANPEGAITNQSLKQPLNVTGLEALTKAILQAKSKNGTTNFQGSKVYFYKTPLRRESGTLLIFQDLSHETNIQTALVTSLIIIGLIYLILTLVGSLFMANRAIGPIQKAWQQQKDFLADASHELRTPLAVVQANLEVVLSNPGENVASQVDWLNNIQDELGQMTGLVSSLLFLARVDSQQKVLNFTEFDLGDLVTGVGEAFQPLAANQRITVSTPGNGALYCYGDAAHLRQVLEILLDNAIRHTPAGGRITLNLTQSDRKLVLTVSDTGTGISPEHLEKIFDRFYQVDASRSKGKAGLGLSIAKSIVENHRGTITVVSKPGSGTTFTIQLPLFKEQRTDGDHCHIKLTDA